ncbi:MAG: hypothetical protein H6825_01380 [Planctomycetes bacterium]|nr:hypothetical protein [Planctomycetota bacterium]
MGGAASTTAGRPKGASRRHTAGRGLWALALALPSLTGCANYDERLREVHTAFYGGQPGTAVTRLAEMLDDEGDDGVDAPVLRLELAMASQAAGDPVRAAELLKESADDIDVIDYTTDPQSKLIAFALRPGSNPYRATPPEWVMIHTENVVNQLLAGDMASAEVEARRTIGVLTASMDEMERYSNKFSWGLAGLVLERSGDWSAASDAYRFAEGSGLESSAIAAGPTLPGEAAGTILVVLQAGKVPMRREQMIVVPWGGRIFRVNIPALVRRPSSFEGASVALDGDARGDVPMLYDLGAHTLLRFDDERPRLIAAAIVQAGASAIASAALGKAAEEAVKRSGDDKKKNKQDDELAKAGAAAVGNIVASAFDLAFGEAQGTDTRSWTLLPDRLGALRLDVPPGKHTVSVLLRGAVPRTVGQTVDVKPGGLVVVNVVTALQGGYSEPPELPPADAAPWMTEIGLAMDVN